MAETAAAHFQRGQELLHGGNAHAAVAELRTAVALSPASGEARFLLGLALQKSGACEDAIAEYRRAIEINPSFAPPYEHLAKLFLLAGRADEAIEVLQRSLPITPDRAQAHARIAVLRLSQTRLAEALAGFETAIALQSENASFHFIYAMALLLGGDFERGWREYEWRWKWNGFRTPNPAFPQPRWDGGDIHGKTILLWCEQGFGDAIQFSRYAQIVASKGAQVILAGPPELKSLLESIEGVSKVVVTGDPVPDFDVHAPLMSLPLLCGTRIDTIPARVPYIAADRDLVEHWRQWFLDKPSGIRIGIAWSGSPTNQDNAIRACRLADFAPLGEIANVSFFSLQKGPAAAEVANAPKNMNLTDLSGHLNDFGDTAAIMQNLDLIITTDTSIPHLAGALGRAVWTLVPYAPDFRWLLNRNDCPWYPTMQLFRQTSPNDWSQAILRAAGALKELAEKG